MHCHSPEAVIVTPQPADTVVDGQSILNQANGAFVIVHTSVLYAMETSPSAALAASAGAAVPPWGPGMAGGSHV